MGLATTLRNSIGRFLLKASVARVGPFSIVSPWFSRSFIYPAFNDLIMEGSKRNAAYAACIATLAFSFPEPPLMVWEDATDSAKPLPNHPIRRLIERPNADMGESEFKAAIITWMAIGGNCYIYKERNNRHEVIGLRPYHDGQVSPVPATDPASPSWVKEYCFRAGDGSEVVIPREDVIHIKWPTPDPHQPWMAQPPIAAAASELRADNEATRFVATLLANDAVPRTIITAAGDIGLTPDEKARLREVWSDRHGGDRRGGVEILDFGAKVERLGLDMDELDFSALHDIPEQRICAVMRVPPSVAGLGDDPTYANSEEAWKRFTLGTLAPLWVAVESEMQADLAPDFGGAPVFIRHDLTKVRAFQEDANRKAERIISGFTAGIAGFREGRNLLGLQEMPADDELFLVPVGTMLVPWRQITATAPTITIDQPQRPALPAPADTEPMDETTAPMPMDEGMKSKQAKGRIGIADLDEDAALEAARKLVEEVANA